MRFIGDLASGDLQVEPVAAGDWMRIAELVHTYRDLPLGTVDASVVAACEPAQDHDRRHHRQTGLHSRSTGPLRPPEPPPRNRPQLGQTGRFLLKETPTATNSSCAVDIVWPCDERRTRMRITLTNVLVDDQAKALAFYTEILGFRKHHDMPVGITRGSPWCPGAARRAGAAP